MQSAIVNQKLFTKSVNMSPEVNVKVEPHFTLGCKLVSSSAARQRIAAESKPQHR